MGARSFVATEEDMQAIIFIRPDDRAVMMVAATLLPKSNRLGEASILRVIDDQHGIGIAFAILGGLDIPVVYDIEPILQVNRLRPLPAIVEHLEFSAVSKCHGSRISRLRNRHAKDQTEQ